MSSSSWGSVIFRKPSFVGVASLAHNRREIASGPQVSLSVPVRFARSGTDSRRRYKFSSSTGARMLSRRQCIGLVEGAVVCACLPTAVSSQTIRPSRTLREYEKPMFDLPGQIKQPVKIESIELLKRGSQFLRPHAIDRRRRWAVADEASRAVRPDLRKARRALTSSARTRARSRRSSMASISRTTSSRASRSGVRSRTSSRACSICSARSRANPSALLGGVVRKRFRSISPARIGSSRPKRKSTSMCAVLRRPGRNGEVQDRRAHERQPAIRIRAEPTPC